METLTLTATVQKDAAMNKFRNEIGDICHLNWRVAMALGCRKPLSDWLAIAFSSLDPPKEKGKKYQLCMQH